MYGLLMIMTNWILIQRSHKGATMGRDTMHSIVNMGFDIIHYASFTIMDIIVLFRMLWLFVLTCLKQCYYFFGQLGQQHTFGHIRETFWI